MDPALALEAREIARNRIINETIARGDSPVQQFYAGAVVLLTGGTGFLGKQLVEKLLRSCNIAKLYMLMRTKKGKSVQERIEKITKDPVFEVLHKIKPDFVTKIYPVVGDVTEIGLGISAKNWEALTNEVTVIIHGAATISFTEPIKMATLTNVRGTREMVTLGKACKKLKAFVYISTAYSHATNQRIKKEVKEKFYDSPISPKALIELAETLDKKTLDDMTPKLLEDWPNTYSFTKAVTEELVRTTAADLPICIVRPAVVICSMREPSPGWIDPRCIMGPTGILYGCGMGLLHTLYLDLSVHLDLVPVDLVNNAIIAAAKETADRRNDGDADIKIYTVTGAKNSTSLKSFVDIALHCCLYSNKSIWYPFVILTEVRWLFLLMHCVLHLIPAYLGDFVLQKLGKRPKAVRLATLMTTFTDIYSYYLTHDWIFDDENCRRLYWNLSPADRIIFNSRTIIDWETYIFIWCIGVRKYIVKDGLSKTGEGVKKVSKMRVVNFLVLLTYFYVLWKIIYVLVMLVYYAIRIFV